MSDWLKPTQQNDLDSESSDDDCTIPYTKPHLKLTYKQWYVENIDAIEEMYAIYNEVGKQIFGSAFNQLGDLTLFANYVFSTMQPGAL